MNIQEQIAIMQHFADGGELETREVCADEWVDVKIPSWNWPHYEYRIKEVLKPKVKMWQALIKDEHGFYIPSRYYESTEGAMSAYGSQFVRLLPHTEIEVGV